MTNIADGIRRVDGVSQTILKQMYTKGVYINNVYKWSGSS